jgi:hypothetical protein
MALDRRQLLASGFVVVSGAVVVVATFLPWAAYENRAIGTTMNYGSGSLGFLLCALAAAAVICAMGSVGYGSILLRGLAVAYGICSVVCSIVLSVARLVEANDAAAAHLGGIRTSRAAGANLAIIGSAVLVVACCMLPPVKSTLPSRSAEGGASRGLALICFLAGLVFGMLFLVIFVTKLTSLFSDVRAGLVMASLAVAAAACFRAAGRARRGPTPAEAS